MGFPTIEFNGTVGQNSTGLGGPDQIESDLLELKKMFDPGTTLKSGSAGGISAGNVQTGALDGRYYTETEIDALCATKAELAALVIGSFGTGFVTDDMLSNTAGQVKPDVAALQTDVSKIDMYAVTTNAGNVYSATLTAAPTVGKPFYLKFNADSTDAVSLIINGAAAKDVKKGNGNAFTNAKNNSIYGFVDNGTNFILQGSDSSGDATAADVRAGKTASTNIGDITGTLTVRTGDNAASAYSMATTTIKLTPPAGIYDGSVDKVTQNLTTVDADLTAANIKVGVGLLGVTGTYTNDANATAAQIFKDKTAYVNGSKLTGTGEVYAQAGNNTLYTAAAGAYNSNPTYPGYAYATMMYGSSKKAAITITYAGTYRVSFTLSAPYAGKTSYAQIYVGSSPVGTLRYIANPTVPTTFTEDITVTAGQTISIFGYCTPAEESFVSIVSDLIIKNTLQTMFTQLSYP